MGEDTYDGADWEVTPFAVSKCDKSYLLYCQHIYDIFLLWVATGYYGPQADMLEDSQESPGCLVEEEVEDEEVESFLIKL